MKHFLTLVIPATVVGALFLTRAENGTAFAADIIGRADKVVDGDTLWVCDQTACHKIRLCGIDAPELESPKGIAARKALEALVDGQTIRCMPVGEGTVCDGRSNRTSYDRIVAQCFADRTDLADELVSAGIACDWVKFSGGHYSQDRPDLACPR